MGGFDRWYQQFQGMAPELRGEQPNRVTGPVRWVTQ
jgi:hypothetical protein